MTPEIVRLVTSALGLVAIALTLLPGFDVQTKAMLLAVGAGALDYRPVP